MMNEVRGGYCGKTLTIDLTSGKVEVQRLAGDLAYDYVGGQGLNAKLLLDAIDPATDATDPANCLIFGAGPLVGTMAPTAARASVASKSPNGFIGFSNAGHFGVMLKYAGYDCLTIKGKAERPVVIRIQDDVVEILPATDVWGEDVFTTCDKLWDRFGHRYWISCIGPAGERMVRFASIVNNKHSAFGRSGMGAVMGSKNLKAMAIQGQGSVRVAHPGKFMKGVNLILQRMQEYSDVIDQARQFGTQMQTLLSPHLSMTRLPKLASDAEVLSAEKYLESYRIGNISCSACPVGCKAWMQHKDGPVLGASCTYGTVTGPYGVGLGIASYKEVTETARLGQNLGLDSMVSASLIALCIELFEAGLLTSSDMDGLEPRWGDTRSIWELMRRMAQREGFGDILADGVAETCRQIGKGSEAFAMHIKGLTMQPEMFPDIRSVVSPETFGSMVNPRGWHIDGYRRPTLYVSDKPVDVVRQYGPHMGIAAEALADIVRGEEYDVAAFTKHAEEYSMLIQSIGTCDRSYVCRSTDVHMLADLYSAATDMDATGSDLLQAAERAINVQKVFNLRAGASRADDRLPERFYREPLEARRGTRPAADPSLIDAMLSDYYAAHGWDRDSGIPTTAKLQSLGLDALSDSLRDSASEFVP